MLRLQLALKSMLMTLNCTSLMSIIKLHHLHNLCKHFVHGLRLDNYLLLITSALSFHSGLKAIYLPHLTILGSKDVSVLVRLYKVYVRPLLESSIQVWNPWLHKDIKCIERVQRFFTRAIYKRAGKRADTTIPRN